MAGESAQAAPPTKRRWLRPRFRLRTLLLFVIFLACILALWRKYVMPYQHEQELIARVKALGFGSLGVGKGQVFTEPRGDYFVRQLVGDRLSQRAVYVHLLSDDVTDAWLAQNVKGLRHVELLNIKSRNVTDAGVAHLKELTCLAELVLTDTEVTDEAIEELQRSLPNLKRVQR